MIGFRAELHCNWKSEQIAAEANLFTSLDCKRSQNASNAPKKENLVESNGESSTANVLNTDGSIEAVNLKLDEKMASPSNATNEHGKSPIAVSLPSNNTQQEPSSIGLSDIPILKSPPPAIKPTSSISVNQIPATNVAVNSIRSADCSAPNKLPDIRMITTRGTKRTQGIPVDQIPATNGAVDSISLAVPRIRIPRKSLDVSERSANAADNSSGSAASSTPICLGKPIKHNADANEISAKKRKYNSKQKNAASTSQSQPGT